MPVIQHQGRLPLYDRVVFFDWHGVLCNDRFWHSVLDAGQHPLRRALGAFATEIFSNEPLVKAWMRGQLSLRDVAKDWPITHKRWDVDFLLRRAERDCSTMRIQPDMAALARELRSSCFVVVATDNMDCFIQAMARHTVARTTFDGIVCSSDIGVLKRDDPERFFGSFLGKVGVALRNSVLVDDSSANCAAFSQAGGRAICHSRPERTRAELRSILFTEQQPSGPCDGHTTSARTSGTV